MADWQDAYPEIGAAPPAPAPSPGGGSASGGTWQDAYPEIGPDGSAPGGAPVAAGEPSAPNPFDQFDKSVNQFDQYDSASPGLGETALDVAKTIPSGLVRGAAGLLGLPGTVGEGMRTASNYLLGKAGVAPAPRLPGTPATPEQITGAVEAATGPLYEPNTTAGKYAEAVSEFVPGAVLPVGGAVGAGARIAPAVARNLVNFAVLPGVASEFAGRQVEGTAAEPYVRTAAGLAAGGAASALRRPSGLPRQVTRAAEGITDEQIKMADKLFNDAAAAGTPITSYEALQAATKGATKFGDIQRVVEGQGALKDFFAQRPEQVEQAGRSALREISPPSTAPSTIGPEVGSGYEGVIGDVRKTINRAAEPSYTAARAERLTPEEFSRVKELPGYPEAAAAVRGDPQLNRYVSDLPDDSIGFLNEVKKQLDQMAENARSPMAQNPNMQRSAGLGRDVSAVKEAAVSASPEYQRALEIEAQARKKYLEPLLQGPIGKLASRDTTTKKAIDTLFPRNPLPNSEEEIGTAISALSRRAPEASRSLVRTYAESVFNQATRDLQAGPNQFGGAGFAAAIRGNPQQAANLEAAITSLPNGEKIWPGFSRFLDILEAQGQRQRIGSQTAFNQELQSELARGTTIAEAIPAVLALAHAPSGPLLFGIRASSRAREAIADWRLGRNVDKLAKLATDPASGKLFERLATAKPGSREFGLIATRLAEMGIVAGTRENQPK